MPHQVPNLPIYDNSNPPKEIKVGDMISYARPDVTPDPSHPPYVYRADAVSSRSLKLADKAIIYHISTKESFCKTTTGKEKFLKGYSFVKVHVQKLNCIRYFPLRKKKILSVNKEDGQYKMNYEHTSYVLEGWELV